MEKTCILQYKSRRENKKITMKLKIKQCNNKEMNCKKKRNLSVTTNYIAKRVSIGTQNQKHRTPEANTTENFLKTF